MISKKMMLAGGAIAALGIAYLMTSGGSDGPGGNSGGNSGGAGLNMPGQGVSMAVPSGGGTAPGTLPPTYSIVLPEMQAVPEMSAPAGMFSQPALPSGYGGMKKDGVVSGIPAPIGGGNTGYIYGMASVPTSSDARSHEYSGGPITSGSAVPSAPLVDTRSSPGSSKKHYTHPTTESGGTGYGGGGAGGRSGDTGGGLGGIADSIGSAIGGLFGW